MINRTIKQKTVNGTKYELSELSDSIGCPINFYVSKELWAGAWETISVHKNYEDAVWAFKSLK